MTAIRQQIYGASRSLRYGAAPVVAALVLAGCATGTTATTAEKADGQFTSHVGARGVPTSPSPRSVGHYICQNLDSSSNAGSELFALSNLKVDHEHQPHFTLKQAEIITYWAVSDLCPQYTSQLEPNWRDGQ